MELTEDQIKEVAEELDCGLRVFVNLETNEVKSVVDNDEYFYGDDEFGDEELNEIQENPDKYFEFEKMDSRDSYRVMAEFTESVEDEELKKKLDLGLNLSKPFRNFKDIIDCEDEYRKKWFEFKNQKIIEHVMEQIDWYNRSE